MWSFFFHLYCDPHVLPLPIELFLTWYHFIFIFRCDITSPLNISICISTRQGHYFLNHCYSLPPPLTLFFKYHSMCSQYSTFPYCSVIFFLKMAYKIHILHLVFHRTLNLQNRICQNPQLPPLKKKCHLLVEEIGSSVS